MIAPVAHISSPENSSLDIVSELTSLMLISLKVLGTVYNPDGINIGMNIGSAAGAGIDDHYHMHIVPRWTGDTNFMSVTAQTRLVPQTLADAWESLKPVFDKECANMK